MPFLIASILIQLCLVVHILKTGRNTTWIWVIVMLPLVGSLAYLILELFPELSSSRSGRKASRKLKTVINPNKDINQATKNYEAADTVENSMRLAQECVNKGLFSEAKELYQKCLRGVHADDPEIMQGLARCQFELGEYLESKDTLEKLIEQNPDYRSQDAHLVYARALEKLGDDVSAEHEYETLHDYARGPEASYYYAKYVQSKGREEAAKKIFQGIVDQSKNAGRHFKELHGSIIAEARRELNN